MVLGYMDGNGNYFGLGGSTGHYSAPWKSAYGLKLPQKSYTTSAGLSNLGITNQSAKSGIITEAHSHTLTTLQCGTWIIKYA